MASGKRVLNLLDEAKSEITTILIDAVRQSFKTDLAPMREAILKSAGKPSRSGSGELAITAFALSKPMGTNPMKAAQMVGHAFGSKLSDSKEVKSSFLQYVDKVEVAGPYINFYFSGLFWGRALQSINSGEFLAPLDSAGKKRVMVEYSQPNTHKAFHVGHMRNAALGDCLVRLYEQMGFPVTAVNYFGDEGAHVASCMWLLKKHIAENGLDLKTVPKKGRGEWLGGFYSKAVEQLSLDCLTSYPFPGVVTAKVLSKDKHTAADAPANWNVLQLDAGALGKHQVVCGGIDYNVGDVVAYVPVGTYKGKEVKAADKKGVKSHGFVVAYTELGLAVPKKEEKKGGKGGKGGKGKEGPPPKKQKKGPKGKPVNTDDAVIFVLPAASALGTDLTELGRLPTSTFSGTVMEEHLRRKQEQGDVLKALEHLEPETVELFNETKMWSLTEFADIYKWLDVRFDHDFFESQEGEPSRKLVIDRFNRNDGVLVKTDGAIGCDLSKHGLGFCLLLKSNGSGLYATKDLSLAIRKFEEFKVDRSIYVVDAAQTLHFAQVFKTLELLGYEQAKKCVHLPYGMVVLPHGKMSSRKGTVIFFSTLKETLETQVRKEFLSAFEGVWSPEEIEEASRCVSVATIKYGMLDHDTAKDVVFNMKDWVARGGKTGPYLLYQYARICAIGSKVTTTGTVNLALLGKREKELACMLNDFWSVVEQAQTDNNPSGLCDYVYEICKAFSSWYKVTSVKHAETEQFKATLLFLLDAIAKVLKKSLFLLGIKTLERM